MINNYNDKPSLLLFIKCVKTIETIKYNTEITKSTLEEANKTYESNYNNTISRLQAPSYPIERTTFTYWDKGKPFLHPGMFLMCFVGLISFGVEAEGNAIGMAFAFRLMGILALICIIYGFCASSESRKIGERDNAEYNSKQKEKYHEELKQYNLEKTKIEGFHNEYTENDLLIHKSLDDELSRLKLLLKKAYSTGIIPVIFQNIEGVYYLYDYLKYSEDTIADALQKCDYSSMKHLMISAIEESSFDFVVNLQENYNNLKTDIDRTLSNNLSNIFDGLPFINDFLVFFTTEFLAYQRAEEWISKILINANIDTNFPWLKTTNYPNTSYTSSFSYSIGIEYVRGHWRCRNGKWEYVRAHTRNRRR